MRIPINMGVKGRVTATLTNTETGERQEVKGNNLILNHYLDWAMTQGLGILGDTTFNRCYIGTSDVPPQPTDTTFVGTQLAVSSESELIKSVKLPTIANLESYIVSNKEAKSSKVAIVKNILLWMFDSEINIYSINPTSGELSLNESNSIFADPGNKFLNISSGGDYVCIETESSPWVQIYENQDGSIIYKGDIEGLTASPAKTKISPDGKFLAVLVNSDSLLVYDLQAETFTPVQTISSLGISGFPNYVDIDFSKNSRRFSVTNMENISTGNYRLRIYHYDEDQELFIRELTSGARYRNESRTYNGFFVGDDAFILLYTDAPYSVIAAHYSEGSWGVVTDKSHQFALDFNRMSKRVIAFNTPSPSSPIGILCLSQNNTLVSYLYDGNMVYQTVFSDNPVDDFAITSDDSFVFTTKGNVLQKYSIRAHEQIVSKSYSRKWTFPAGVGTGTVNRVGLQANSGTGANGNNRHVAQIVLPEPLEKTNLHQLDVIWEIEVENPGVWEGVIPGGSRDGSDLAWRVTINEEQFYNLVQTGYRILANWFGVTGTPNVRIGTSNEESDLIFDRGNIRGGQIQYISSTAIRVSNPYVSGSLKRTIRLFLEVDQGNGQIGEIVFGGSSSGSSLARITFDPPLDKPPHEGEGANPYRLYLDLEIGWQRGE